LLNLASTE
jgi:hypothetical protein